MFPSIKEPLFCHPFTCMVSAPTRAGKTELVKRFIQNAGELMDVPPKRIYWYYAEWQPAYENLSQYCTLIDGLPELSELKSDPALPKLVVLDDLMCQADKKVKELNTLFTRGAHHWNCSVIHIVQNAFFGNLRTARINSHYIFLMKNPGDTNQVKQLGLQIFPDRLKEFLDAYRKATLPKYGYLLIDLHPDCPDELRLRTNIFPSEFTRAFLL